MNAIVACYRAMVLYLLYVVYKYLARLNGKRGQVGGNGSLVDSTRHPPPAPGTSKTAIMQNANVEQISCLTRSLDKSHNSTQPKPLYFVCLQTNGMMGILNVLITE